MNTTEDGIRKSRAEGRVTERGVKLPEAAPLPQQKKKPKCSEAERAMFDRPVWAYADEVEVPVPPSTNNLYVNRAKGRSKSTEYRDWIATVSMRMMVLRPINTGPFRITYTLMGGSDLNLGRDLGNIEKPLTDLLVSTKRICNDSLRAGLHEIILRYVECGEGAAFVRIETRSL